MWLVMAQAAEAPGLDLWNILLNAHPVSKVVFAILVVCSVWSVAVIIERIIVLRRTWRNALEGQALLDAWAESSDWTMGKETIRRATREGSPLFSVLRAGIACWDELLQVGETRIEVMEDMVNSAIGRELKLVRAMLRANLSSLANISSTAPFIGLFGTVIGIILTFDTIAREHNMGPDLVGSGIADALVATAMGLFAAIPAVIAYNVFTDKVNQSVLGMEEIAMERIYFLVERTEQIKTSARGAR